MSPSSSTKKLPEHLAPQGHILRPWPPIHRLLRPFVVGGVLGVNRRAIVSLLYSSMFPKARRRSSVVFSRIPPPLPSSFPLGSIQSELHNVASASQEKDRMTTHRQVKDSDTCKHTACVRMYNAKAGTSGHTSPQNSNPSCPYESPPTSPQGSIVQPTVQRDPGARGYMYRWAYTCRRLPLSEAGHRARPGRRDEINL